MIHLFSSLTLAASSFPFTPLRLSPIANKDTMNPSAPTLQNTSSSQRGQGQTHNQHSMRHKLLLCLQSLDSLKDRVDKDILDTRNFILDRLNDCQSDLTMADSGGYDNTVNYQAGFDEPNATQTFLSPQDRYTTLQLAPHGISREARESLSEDAEPLRSPRSSAHYGSEATLPFHQGNTYVTHPHPSQFSQDSSCHGTSSSGYERVAYPVRRTDFEEDGKPAAQSQPQYSVYREPTLPFLQGGQHVTEPPPSQFSQDSSLQGTSSFGYEQVVLSFQSTYLDGHGPST